MASLLIADDHAVVRTGYRRIFEQSGQHTIVAETHSGHDVIPLIKEASPDVVILDVMMDGPGIINIITRVLTQNKHMRIIVVSMHDNLSLVERCLKAGALAYITKLSPSSSLLSGLEEVIKRRRYLSHDVAEKLAMKQLDLKGHSSLTSLSTREFDVFLRLVRGGSISNISTNMNISKKTASNYLSKIKSKLGVSTTAELVHLAFQENILEF